MVCKNDYKQSMVKDRTDSFVGVSIFVFLLMIVGSWGYIFYVDGASLSELFSEKNMTFATRFLKRMVYDGQNTPAYIDGSKIAEVVDLMLETVRMSILAIVFSTLGMLMTLIPIMVSVIKKTPSRLERIIAAGIRLFVHVSYLISRSVPELIWAMILIFIFRPGILPGALALGIHNFGILGKLCFEVVENMDHSPLVGVAQCGANRRQILIYGILPNVMPKFVSYIVYRWEVILRTTIVVGMVGAGGLGQAFKLHLSWFHYTSVTLILIAYLILVFLSDKLSENLRR